MTMKLYFSPGASSFVPHALLEMTGAQFEPVIVKLHRKEQYEPEYKAINPHSQVPALVVDGGQALTQILAIVLYLHEKFPQQCFLPTEPWAKAKALETLAWMNNTVHPTFTHVFKPDKFTDQLEAQAQIKAYNAVAYRPMLAEIEALVQATQAKGQPWLDGAKPGPIDAYALTLLRWGGFVGIDPTGFGALWAHVQKFAEQPAVARTMERERLQLNLYKPA